MTGLLVAMVLSLASPLDPAREAYQSGELAQARAELEAVLYPLRLDDDGLEAEAHLLLAATYHAQEDPSRAENEVVLGLAASRDATLDPLVYPPDFIAFVERVRTVHGERIAALAAARRRPILVPPVLASPGAVPERPAAPAVATVSRGWYLVPFGVGHFQHGKHAKGTVLAVSQGAFFALSAASLGGALALRGDDGLYSAGDAGKARGLNVSYLAGAYAFAALYAYGVLDGFLSSPEGAGERAR
ncbi:hypothetical protein [Stigmatella aurantiaca]|uniref:Conserved uncharacterized protein n=1 Tax=Stigmatella aurantiaca (strain DW4/3-1) TaxID=378806 RepID=Q08RG5_STIAD|nr:hypothetical protein [Stigmatella aurantiaca]ADO72564.1 conserved uncharacterized protein [Stigmatella aurantiaca DW4/3-1]EAU63076.1 hypothetical protein STIAU_0944 [Stigmatella aurantiaca DW4/3-1]